MVCDDEVPPLPGGTAGDKGRGTRGEAHEGGGEWKQTTHTHTYRGRGEGEGDIKQKTQTEGAQRQGEKGTCELMHT